MIDDQSSENQYMREPTKPAAPSEPPRWLRHLRPHEHAPNPASSAVTIADAIDHIRTGAVEWECEVDHGMATHIIDEIPELG